jgi:uncharacterized protein YegJ (DUF2314 family)
MFDWLKKNIAYTGSVLFRGSLPPRLDELTGLRQAGVRVKPREVASDAHWAADLSHPAWGEAILVCPRGVPRPPPEMIEHDTGLSAEETREALAGRTHVSVRMEGTKGKGNLLRDRKTLFRFLRAVMGDDGVVAMDHVAMRLWSPDALHDELAHDADLDIEALYCLHAVAPEGAERATWIHTHGLAEIDYFDFDVLDPSEDLGGAYADTFRAVAFAIVEGTVARSTPRFELAQPGGVVRFVDVADFNRRADLNAVALRCDAGEDHNTDRSILCQPAGGLLGRFFDKPRPARFLSGSMPEKAIVRFSAEAGELMAARAKATYGRFRELAEEFKEFEFGVIVKLGYPVDGGDPTDKEHLWFSVNELMDDKIDGTLENQPLNVARMRQGERGVHDLSLMSDWHIITPAGMISPRNTVPARVVREHKDELREAMREHRKAQGG